MPAAWKVAEAKKAGVKVPSGSRRVRSEPAPPPAPEVRDRRTSKKKLAALAVGSGLVGLESGGALQRKIDRDKEKASMSKGITLGHGDNRLDRRTMAEIRERTHALKTKARTAGSHGDSSSPLARAARRGGSAVFKADRDQNSSVPTSTSRANPTGPHRKASTSATAVGNAGGSQRRPFAAKDQNSSISVTRVQPRRLDGKFSAPAIEHFTPKYRMGPVKPHTPFLGHYTKQGDKAAKTFVGKADSGLVRTGRRL